MQVEIKVPTLAESVSEARVLDWHKQEGAPVQRGDSLVDIETDKVTLELSAPEHGVLERIHKQRGARVDSGELLAVLRTGEAAAAGADVPDAVEPRASAVTPVPEAAEPKADSVDPQLALEPAPVTPKLSPAVRALLREHDLAAEQVPIIGGGKRLRKKDVLAYLKTLRTDGGTVAEPVEPPPVPAPKADPEPGADSGELVSTPAAPSRERRVERVPMSGLRRYIARRLLQAQREHVILTTFNEVDMRDVLELRKSYRDEFERRHGVRLGLMSFFVRAVVGALRRFPLLNASVEEDHIVQHHYFDIGVAVSVPRGLVVPVLRDVDSLSLAAIECGIREFASKARDSTLSAEELSGGTFTVTNGGVFGSLLSTPILNPPQSGILGMHKIQSRPVAVADQVELRPMMYLALSYDHRIVDGREAVGFLVAVKEQLEDPARMLLEL